MVNSLAMPIPHAHIQPQTPVSCYYARGRRCSSTRPLSLLVTDASCTSRQFPCDGRSCASIQDMEPTSSQRSDTDVASRLRLAEVHIHGCQTNELHGFCQGDATSFPNSSDPLFREAGVSEGACNESNTPTVHIPERFKCRFASACFAFFTLGWADGVTGTLLPHFEADFHLNYMLSSLFFVASATGYAIGTLLVERVTRALGRYHLTSTRTHLFVPFFARLVERQPLCTEKNNVSTIGYSASQSRFLTLVLASLLHAGFFAIMGSRRGFPSMLVAYVLSAFARSFVSATLNLYVSSTPNKALGYIYGTWAIGAFGAPLVCQSVIATGIPWAHFYLGSLVVSAINTTFIVFAFRPTQSESRIELELAWEGAREKTPYAHNPIPGPMRSELLIIATREKYAIPSVNTEELSAPVGTLRRVIKEPYLWVFSVFSWLYTGTESSTQGYIVLYLLNTRHANPKTVGYVQSGFWGGMAISRLIWGYASSRVSFTQRKYIVQSCIFVALVMHILIWFVRSFVENAFSTAVIGAVYGPIFPSNLSLANDVLPSKLHMVSMAVISAFASFGAALFPFITGTLSKIKGPHILPYVTVAQTGAMFCLWALFPSKLSAEGRTRGG